MHYGYQLKEDLVELRITAIHIDLSEMIVENFWSSHLEMFPFLTTLIAVWMCAAASTLYEAIV